MLNKALQSQLLLDTAGSGLLGSQLHLSDESRMQHLALQMAGRDADKDHLLARLSDMELVLQQQQQVNVQAQQTITKLQAQIILLEERYRLTSNGGADLPQQDEGLALQQALSGRHGLEADLLAAAAAANSTSPGALRAAMSMPGASAFAAAAAGSSAGGSVLETSSSGGSSSTTTTGPASSSVPSGSGDSSSSSAEGTATAPWQRGAGYSAFGLHPAPSAPSHLAAAADLPGGSLPVLQPSLDALVSPLPTSLSGLSRSLSLSATAAGAKQQQQQQHKPRQPGGSAGGALGADHNSSSEEFAQDAEVWPAPLASRSQSLLSTRDLGPPPAAADSTWRFSSSTGAAAPGGLAASLGSTNGGVTPPAVTGSGSGFPMRTPPQPIMGPHSAARHGLHGAAAAAAASAAAAAAATVSPWAAGPGMSPTVGAAAGPLAAGIPGSSSNLPFSPASWEHPLLVAGRQGSALGLDPLAAAGDSAAAAAAAAAATAEYHSLLAAAAAGLDIQAVAAAAAANAANAGLHGMASDRFSHDSNLARLLPVDLKRLVTEGSLGSLSGSLQQAHSGLLGASHGSLDDLQQALVAQQLAAAVHQGQQQQHSAAAMAAAAAAAVAAAAMQQQGQLNAAAAAATAAASNATVRGGKPLQPFGSGGGMGAAPVPLKGSSSSAGGGRIPIPMPNSRSGSLSSSRSNHALVRAASGPASSAFLDADDPAALFSALGSSNDLSVRGQSEVVFARGSGSLREAGLLSQAVEAEAREREKRVVRKWTDCWGPDSEAEQGPASPTAAAAAREAGGAYGSSGGGGGMSRSLPAAAGSGGLAAAAMAELPDTADNDLPDQDSLLARINSSGGGGGASFGRASLAASASSAGLGLGLRQPSGCSLTRSASALAASEMSQGGCRDEDGAGAGDLDAAAQNARLRSKQDACPNTCVYVGFLGWWVSEKDLVEYFSPYGELVSVRLLISKKSRRSREQAFVEYAEVEQAQKAITWLDSIDYPALVKQLGCGGLVVRFADRKKPAFE